MKLKLCRNVHNISLYKNYVFYCGCSCAFSCYDNLNFPLSCNGKSESRPLLLSHCRYFDKSYTERLLQLSSIKHMNFVETSEFDWLP